MIVFEIKIKIMFNSDSWLNYWSYVTVIICAYYLIVYLIYYSTNIKKISSVPFAWLNKLKSKPQTANEKLQEEVNKRAKELEKISVQEKLVKNCKLYCLTNRETEIAQFVCKGLTYKQIAETLFIAERTVTKHAQNIFEKVGVNNKLELCKKLENVLTLKQTQ